MTKAFVCNNIWYRSTITIEPNIPCNSCEQLKCIRTIDYCADHACKEKRMGPS